MSLTKSFYNMIRDENGAALPEYALLIALIAVVAIAAMTAMGDHIKNLFTSVNDKLVGPK